MSAAFSLAAAAFFPALVLGIFWRRANGCRRGGRHAQPGVIAVRLGYMAVNLPVLRTLFGVTRPLAQTQWWGVDAIAAGVFAVPLGAGRAGSP